MSSMTYQSYPNLFRRYLHSWCFIKDIHIVWFVEMIKYGRTWLRVWKQTKSIVGVYFRSICLLTFHCGVFWVCPCLIKTLVVSTVVDFSLGF